LLAIMHHPEQKYITPT